MEHRQATSGKDSSLTTQRQTVMRSHAESLAVGIAVDSMSSLLCAARPFYARCPQDLMARVYEEELQDSRSSQAFDRFDFVFQLLDVVRGVHRIPNSECDNPLPTLCPKASIPILRWQVDCQNSIDFEIEKADSVVQILPETFEIESKAVDKVRALT